ncbi:relaxase/mobilization nuclease domain-containing protein [Pantoea vagans]|uniref:relaxase/mobilization nuclease domain-containing protein n=1 Tax=Pantoea vagans TaxID=470934 RepID=UPI0023AEDEEE|nr:relaxase/mobilization nuclease domain-containing protein [Pantoea vagans]MDE8556835.1 relaxase/mobilization nuclease domain-containing protein [Pantoea vagans]MDE8576841.1 relaxase/mobilization nuclease domain-containing protein [Pantoea vagans]
MQKIKRGKSFAGVVFYALKPGKHHKTNPVVIGGNMLGDSAAELIAEFSASASLRADVAKPVWHNSLRLPQGESLTAKQWVVFADDYMNRMGFSETHLRCYVIHDDEAGQHIHIIASRVDLINGGKLYLGRNENLISTRVIQELELAHDLTITKGPSPLQCPTPSTRRKRLSRGEEQKEKREGQPSPKTFLQNTIDEILTSASNIKSFVEALAENGITTIPNIASSGRMNGFSFEYSGIAFKASQLGKAYSWATLQEKLSYASERDNPLLLALKASAIGSPEASESVTEASNEDTTPSLTAPMTGEVTGPPQREHRVETAETCEAHTPASTVLTAPRQANNNGYLMTAVIKWLLSIPYLQALAKLLKETGKTFLHRKSSFSVISMVRSAEPDLKTSNEVPHDFLKSSYTPN